MISLLILEGSVRWRISKPSFGCKKNIEVRVLYHAAKRLPRPNPFKKLGSDKQCPLLLSFFFRFRQHQIRATYQYLFATNRNQQEYNKYDTFYNSLLKHRIPNSGLLILLSRSQCIKQINFLVSQLQQRTFRSYRHSVRNNLFKKRELFS